MCYVNTHMGVGDKRKRKKSESERCGGWVSSLFLFFSSSFTFTQTTRTRTRCTRSTHTPGSRPQYIPNKGALTLTLTHIYASKSGPDELPETYYTKNRNRWLYEQNWSFLSPRLWVAAHVMYRLCPRMRLCDNEMP